MMTWGRWGGAARVGARQGQGRGGRRAGWSQQTYLGSEFSAAGTIDADISARTGKAAHLMAQLAPMLKVRSLGLTSSFSGSVSTSSFMRRSRMGRSSSCKVDSGARNRGEALVGTARPCGQGCRQAGRLHGSGRAAPARPKPGPAAPPNLPLLRFRPLRPPAARGLGRGSCQCARRQSAPGNRPHLK